MSSRSSKFLAVFTLVAASCSSTHLTTTDTRPHPVADAGSDSSPPLPFACSGTACEPLTGIDGLSGLRHVGVAGYEVSPCCTPDGACGATTKMAPGECLPLNAPGGADPACQSFEGANHERPAPCCASDGHCGGKQGPFLQDWQLGCVTGVNWGQSAQSCPYDPSNDCTEVVPLACDGPEDCGDGMKCCSVQDTFGTIDAYQCLTSCGLGEELCHLGANCERPNAGGGSTNSECKQDPNHPFLGSCPGFVEAPPPAQATTLPGEINCGEAGVCGPGTQCCLRVPYGPYCGPSDQPCSCKPR
jgi:hypothetical protein